MHRTRVRDVEGDDAQMHGNGNYLHPIHVHIVDELVVQFHLVELFIIQLAVLWQLKLVTCRIWCFPTSCKQCSAVDRY